MLKNIIRSKYCQISSPKLNKTHKVCSTIVQNQLGLPKYMNLSDTQIHQFTKCLHDISSNEKCSTCTTNEAHCLGAITIQLMKDAGLDLNICFKHFSYSIQNLETNFSERGEYVTGYPGV